MSNSGQNPRQIAKRLRRAVNDFDQAHRELRDEMENLRSAAIDAIGFLEAFADLAERVEARPYQLGDVGPDDWSTEAPPRDWLPDQ